MSTLVTSGRATVNLPEIALRIFAAFRALAARPYAHVFELRAPLWHSLNARMLRDLGASPAEAEIARLRHRWGAPERVNADPLANRGLG
jgi:hypothetical protein